MIFGTQDIDGDDTALRDTVEGYLAHKWGIDGDLPQNHPYKNAAPESAIPEPGSLALLGLAGLMVARRRRG